MNKQTILVVDDEEDILELVSLNLELEEFNVLKAADGEIALSIIWDENVDLLILDLMLPGINGLEVLKSIRKNERTKDLPVILLTAKTTEIDKIIGFELGTDDYVSKPFSVKELLARTKALLKRSSGFSKDNIFNLNNFFVNFNSHIVRVDGSLVELSPKEFGILKYLFKKQGQVISRDQILEKIWGYDSTVEERAVDVNITRLRDKLKSYKKIIKTVKGYGYIFEPENLK